MASVDHPEDLNHTCWRHDLWLASYPLTRATVLDYFALSPFYDRNCLNERAKEQGVEPSRTFTLAPGMEYTLQDFQEPHLYIVVKQMRTSFSAATAQSVYYVLDATVYQAPTLHAVLQARMKRCLFHIKAAFSTMRQDLDPLTTGQRLLDTPPEKAHRMLETTAAAQQPVSRAEGPSTAAAVPTREQVAKVDRVLASALAQRVQQITLEAAAQGVAEDAGGQEVAAPPEVKVEEVKAAEVVEVKQEERKEGAPPPIKRRLTLKRSVSKPAI